MLLLITNVGMALCGGCAARRGGVEANRPDERPIVVAVAPLLNLSDSTDFDPVRFTDMLASELQSFDRIAVIPVNRVMATLELRGERIVKTPRDALELAEELNADATIVAAVTEFDPYDPPRIGLLLQWYERSRGESGRPLGFDPVAASRSASATALASHAEAGGEDAPFLQVQRVIDASRSDVLSDMRSYGARRTGHASSFDWRVHMKAQELFVRYACNAVIRPMLEQRARNGGQDGAHEAAP